MKFSTLHSFKGWEIHTVFFILSDVDEEMEPQVGNSLLENYVSPEIIYTGITRARNNLNIINIGVDKYDDFFEYEIVLS
jgi:superfamily I DNA/RNA helicase